MDAILTAAAHIAKHRGFEAATTNRIAELAGVSIGSLYQYFENKEAILDELRDRHHDWFDHSLREEMDRGERLPLRAAIRSSVEMLVSMHAVDPDGHREMSHAGRDGRPLGPDQIAEFRGRMRDYLEAHADEIRSVDVELVTVIATRALEAVIHGIGSDEPEWLRHPRFAEEVTELLVRYLEA